MKVALLQLTSGDDPEENLRTVRAMVSEAAGDGADLVLTPEVTNCVSLSRKHQKAVLSSEKKDPVLAGLREAARDAGIWLLIGSLALKSGEPKGRFVNRSFLIAPDGEIAARYDKIHMFDVQIDEEEAFRESAAFRPGDRAVVAKTPFGKIGLSICYDLRFPHLYQGLALSGASILTVPSAFSPVTGAAHWHPLLRARAIETGCYVLAPAQTGTHAAAEGKPRKTYGHSLVVAPWGEIVLDAGTEPGIYAAELDLAEVERARSRVPSLTHIRDYREPKG